MAEESNIPEGFYKVSVKALVVNDEGKIMLCKEEDGGWELPGGSVDFGESFKDCLTREVKEEMGVNVIEMDNNPKYAWKYKKSEKIHRVFLGFRAKLDSFDFTPSDECVELNFFSKDELSKINLQPHCRPIVELFNPKDFGK